MGSQLILFRTWPLWFCILDAIAEKTDLTERRDAFHALADARYAQFIADGKTIPWDEMRSYLEARLAGKSMPRPVARKRTRRDF
jgi:hypothetical protein